MLKMLSKLPSSTNKYIGMAQGNHNANKHKTKQPTLCGADLWEIHKAILLSLNILILSSITNHQVQWC
jgi:hypothetical protein